MNTYELSNGHLTDKLKAFKLGRVLMVECREDPPGQINTERKIFIQTFKFEVIRLTPHAIWDGSIGR